ncbi:ATP-binding protein [Mesorhizobium sp. M2D.F.Ca.ET.185.01.1.1]|uniref:AAA family ATPase n=1 Tax=unclassified Mesorhizobium TaxID=325217 RepID=UPI000FCAE0B2|nr:MULTISPECIES: AAA family ATPase [unclassified Mesorhizobium]TGP73707.1 ATP-binding protein [bacterium M00.F.Ca.ET.227.01.1.1]TGP86431.1 ATP-binding protein [bacterium M00.F.Ca.ET.221.01.1.1]TGP86642.1 ATP-binding protein [bacterium M00.F.Ca.ET.222.01.1.1]TGU04620.1 ATP-binding protein [bacterium M00.F.Ca.ET.163.01.1.1]TGU18399.1 ATP-binding protein [bacterium M00.F.Ca.ET.156.01.1.1]TGU43264.1 ATP-binding protein [bacterium M00.F.Ca.ET.146.01.1.1]TGV65962.1 ATP-binding protein [Mesorhizobi
MAARKQLTRLKAPYLRRILLEPSRVADWDKYPWNLPLFREGAFEFEFASAITIIVGENGTGKSTLLEAIGALAGYDEAGGGKGYMPVDHSRAIDKSGAGLASSFRCHWLPKVTAGWFFRAESFYSVARYLDAAARESGGAPPDFLSWSHGEGFIRFFEERCRRQGIYILDEPESALSPTRQIELLKLLQRMEQSGTAQVIMATHSPLLMACPNARLFRISRFGLDLIDFQDTDHFRMMRDFCSDPAAFLAEALYEDEP